MTERVVEIGEAAARLSVRYEQLVIERDGVERVTTPLEEVAVLVFSHPQAVITQAVMTGIAERGGAVVLCDAKHQPAAMMLPLMAHSTQAERFAQQAQMSAPLRKRLWQQIVRGKIRAQGQLLKTLHGSDAGLLAIAGRVRSGDVGNLESQASRRYWPLLFGNPRFRRGSEGPDQNQHLNYGYAVLRAAMARALCSAGLHPSFGLQHHNRYDAFCLASDLMEPFRPLIDRVVYDWVQDNDPTGPLDKAAKAWLIQPMLRRYQVENEERAFFDVAARYASSLAQVVMEKGKELWLPEVG